MSVRSGHACADHCPMAGTADDKPRGGRLPISQKAEFLEITGLERCPESPHIPEAHEVRTSVSTHVPDLGMPSRDVRELLTLPGTRRSQDSPANPDIHHYQDIPDIPDIPETPDIPSLRPMS